MAMHAIVTPVAARMRMRPIRSNPAMTRSTFLSVTRSLSRSQGSVTNDRSHQQRGCGQIAGERDDIGERGDQGSGGDLRVQMPAMDKARDDVAQGGPDGAGNDERSSHGDREGK